jgi:hypothetical protein
MSAIESLNGQVGLFFVADGKLLMHKCAVAVCDKYGDFINYPESHDEVWQREYAAKYGVDFDYYPRGRILYNVRTNKFLIYHDPCIANIAESLRKLYPESQCVTVLDEHYQCHHCNPDYVV